MTVYTDAATIRSKTTPGGAETRSHADAGTVRSKSTIAVDDHFCTYIPVFVFNAQSHFLVDDNYTRWNLDNGSRWTFFVELNPQANPC